MSIRQATEPVPLREAVAELLGRSDELDRAYQIGLAWWRWGYRLGLVVGIDRGRRQAEAEQAASWREVAAPIARSSGEVQQRRWTIRGEARTRETFGKPADGDYPGKGAA
jgi:hypothetical protein